MKNQMVVQIPLQLWRLTWEGLKKRSYGDVESLCIWAGKRSQDLGVVSDVMFLDGIVGVEAFPLFHRISREATAEIFAAIRAKGLQLIADVHTHPEHWVGLSETDREHPFEYRVGFVSIVLPHFATSEPAIRSIGMHRYEGNLQWYELDDAEKQKYLEVK